MNLRDLKYLVAVADLGHFGKAALASHISQPTLSMQLKKLEDTLGVQLFERNNKQVMITPVGREIAQKARAILQEVDTLYDIASNAQDPFSGELRLGIFPTLAPYFLPLAVPVFHAHLPKLKLMLVEEKTDRLIAQLKEGTLDATFLALPVKEEGLEEASLFDDPFLLAVPQGHPLAKRKYVSDQDIAQETLLLLEEGHCLRSQALEFCSLTGTSENEDFRATSLETLRQMVATGVGITLIPRLAARQDDGIAYVPFKSPAPSRSIGLVWRKRSSRKPCIDVLLSLSRDLA